jgi:hypothetical protein
MSNVSIFVLVSLKFRRIANILIRTDNAMAKKAKGEKKKQ